MRIKVPALKFKVILRTLVPWPGSLLLGPSPSRAPSSPLSTPALTASRHSPCCPGPPRLCLAVAGHRSCRTDPPPPCSLSPLPGLRGPRRLLLLRETRRSLRVPPRSVLEVHTAGGASLFLVLVPPHSHPSSRGITWTRRGAGDRDLDLILSSLAYVSRLRGSHVTAPSLGFLICTPHTRAGPAFPEHPLCAVHRKLVCPLSPRPRPQETRHGVPGWQLRRVLLRAVESRASPS